MNQNVLLTLFPVSSEAYQAFNELKVYRQTAETIIAQAVLIKKQNGVITMVDAFDASEKINSGMLTGGLIGGLLGIIGGPLGMLLVGSLGALIGGNVKAAESIGEGTLLIQAGVATDLQVINGVYHAFEKVSQTSPQTKAYHAARTEAIKGMLNP